jgi:hypothetical protein
MRAMRLLADNGDAPQLSFPPLAASQRVFWKALRSRKRESLAQGTQEYIKCAPRVHAQRVQMGVALKCSISPPSAIRSCADAAEIKSRNYCWQTGISRNSSQVAVLWYSLRFRGRM